LDTVTGAGLALDLHNWSCSLNMPRLYTRHQRTQHFMSTIQLDLCPLALPVKNWRILLEKVFTVRVSLPMENSTFGLRTRSTQTDGQTHPHSHTPTVLPRPLKWEVTMSCSYLPSFRAGTSLIK